MRGLGECGRRTGRERGEKGQIELAKKLLAGETSQGLIRRRLPSR